MPTDYTTKYSTGIGPLGNEIPGTVEQGSDGELRMSVVPRSSGGVELFTATNPIAAEVDGVATAALQETGNEALATLLSNIATIINKMIAAPATEAKQDTANLSLTSIATNTAAGATQETAADILEAMPTGYATAALQETGNTSLANLDIALTTLRDAILGTNSKTLTDIVTALGSVVLAAGTNVIGKVGIDGAYTTPTHTAVGVTTSNGQALASNTSRKYALFVNNSAYTQFLKFGADAVLNEGIRLNANGGSYEMSATQGNLYLGAVNVISAAVGTLLVTEGV
jgi:hypothetical protein